MTVVSTKWIYRGLWQAQARAAVTTITVSPLVTVNAMSNIRTPISRSVYYLCLVLLLLLLLLLHWKGSCQQQ